MKFDILNFSNQKTGDLELSDELFGILPRGDILARVIHWQQSKARQGTHAVKERGDVSGSTKKVGRQKGGGCARHGSKRGAQFRGGGIIFGPVVRDHGYSLPKKIRRLGVRMAIASKIQENNFLVLDSLSLSSCKTKDLVSALSSFGSKKFLLIDDMVKDTNLQKASANVFSVNVLPQIKINVLDLVKSDKVIFSVSAIKLLEERLRS